MRKAGWPTDWIDECEDMMEEVIASSPDSRERIAAFLAMLDDAVQAHRPWALELDADIRRKGAGSEVSSYAKSRTAPALISFDGRLLSKPAVAGFRRTRGNGQRWVAQELIVVAPWGELKAKRAEQLTMERAYSSNVALYDRLLALHELAPEAGNPVEACEALGLSMDDYLIGSIAA